MLLFTITADNVETHEHRVIVSIDMSEGEASEWFEAAVASYAPDWRLTLTAHRTSFGAKDPSES